jgi:hypothetical protein
MCDRSGFGLGDLVKCRFEGTFTSEVVSRSGPVTADGD